MNQNGIDYSKICFVIMPFGTKTLASEGINGTAGKRVEKTIDFDALYADIFVPAISAVNLPENGKLESHRTDQDFFTGDTKQDMFEYLEYSRFALCDITGLSPNVMYELGVRPRAREAGTAIFRQRSAAAL